MRRNIHNSTNDFGKSFVILGILTNNLLVSISCNYGVKFFFNSETAKRGSNSKLYNSHINI